MQDSDPLGKLNKPEPSLHREIYEKLTTPMQIRWGNGTAFVLNGRAWYIEDGPDPKMTDLNYPQ